MSRLTATITTKLTTPEPLSPEPPSSEDPSTTFVPEHFQIPQDLPSDSDSLNSSSDEYVESECDDSSSDEDSAPGIPYSLVRGDNDGDNVETAVCGPLLGNQMQLHSFIKTAVDEAVLGLMGSFLQHKKNNLFVFEK